MITKTTAVSALALEEPARPIVDPVQVNLDPSLPPVSPAKPHPGSLVAVEPASTPLDSDALTSDFGPALAPLVERFVGEARALGLLGSDVLVQVFNALRQGDAEAALELFGTLIKLVDPTAGGGGAKKTEDRAGAESRIELGALERDAALEQLAKAREAYRSAMVQLRALEQEMSALRGALVAEAGETRLALKTDVPVEAISGLASERQRYLDRRRELSGLSEPLHVSQDMIDHAESLAERFASNADNPGYLTRDQASQLAAALLAVPRVGEVAHVQVSPALVRAAIRGFERATNDPRAKEILAAQLARTAYSLADSRPVAGTKKGWGREALKPYMRSAESLTVDFKGRLDAAPIHGDDATARSQRAGANIVRQGPMRTDYDPGEILRATFTVDSAELPLELSASARWSSYPPEEYENRETPNTRWRYRFSEGADGEVKVERISQTQPRFGVAWSEWSEPETLPSLNRDEAGHFHVVLEAQPLEEIDRLGQTYQLLLGGSVASFRHEAETR